MADTVGVAKPSQVSSILGHLIPKYPGVEFGVHLHSTPANREQKINAALDAGCKRFDGALKGIGGCPMATNDLVGNMNTECMIRYFKEMNMLSSINEYALEEALNLADEIFT